MTCLSSCSIPRILIPLVNAIWSSIAVTDPLRARQPFKCTSMDPLSALSIAGNVIQFLDFSTKLFKEAREIYHSSSGTSSGVRTLGTISEQLATLRKSFTAEDLKSLDLKEMAVQCNGVADEMRALVDRVTLKKPGGDGYWASFALALRTVLSKGQIQNLERRLDKLQKQLGLQMQKLVL